MFVTLAGGVGAARFLNGLVQVIHPSSVTAIVNTGDDFERYGLSISPDIDTVLYTLSGLVQADRGWGVANDSFTVLSTLRRLGDNTWFQLGDRDLALHLLRTGLLHEGRTLSEVTAILAERLGVAVRVLPMTDSPVRTIVDTDAGPLAFQEYFVQRRQEDRVSGVRLDGSDTARPAPGTLEAITSAEAIFIAPSNPFVSIGTILAVDGFREAIAASGAPVIAVSPILGGAAVKGPLGAMLESMGHEVSAVGVARLYQDLVDVFVIDSVDTELAPAIEAIGMRTVVTETLMRGPREQARLAAALLAAR